MDILHERPGRRLASAEEARKRYRYLGVAVFVLNREGKIFVIQDMTDKEETGRVAGEFGIPCETLKPGEGFEDAVPRCLLEELGIHPARLATGFQVDSRDCCIGEGVAGGVFGRGYQVEWTGEDDELLEFIGDGEAKKVGWKTLRELRKLPLRRATQVALRLHVPNVSPVRGRKASPLPLLVENLRMAA